MRPLAGIVSYEPSELVVTALAGTPLAELEGAGSAWPVPGLRAAALCRWWHRWAWWPPACRPGARASVGAVRDFVLGVEIINGRGELLRFGGQVMKNVAGYDVSRLMAGSWGTLGVITEVSLKVLPRGAGRGHAALTAARPRR